MKWGSSISVFSCKHLKLKLRVSLTGFTVTMVTGYIMTMTITCSPKTGHDNIMSDTIIIALIDEQW